jgi:hypothetical protein
MASSLKRLCYRGHSSRLTHSWIWLSARRSPHLVEQREDERDARQVDPDMLRKVLDALQALDIAVGIEAVLADLARLDQAQAVVHAQGLGMNRLHPVAVLVGALQRPHQLRRDADRVDGLVSVLRKCHCNHL